MRFDCYFSRLVNLDHETDMTHLAPLERKNVHRKFGVLNLEYDLKVEYVPDVGNIQIQIKPMHRIQEISAR